MSSEIAASSIQSASSIQLDYMKVLVAQLKNQDPTEPLNNNEMATQLAQLSSLQQLESMNGKLDSMNGNFADVLKNAEKEYAASLLGKTVAYNVTSENGQSSVSSGKVGQVFNDIDGKIMLMVSGTPVELGNIVGVAN